MKKLKLAIQKSGRLKEGSLQLLAECGVQIDNGRDQLKVTARNFPIEVYYLRNNDILAYVRDGVVDVTIIGENLRVEKGQALETVIPLGFSKCRVSLAIPDNQEFKGLDLNTKDMLMLGCMNEAALNITLETKKVTFFSRSRNELWTKGETSGNYLNLESIALDCDGDALLVLASPEGPTCHKNTTTCWGNTNSSQIGFIDELRSVIHQRNLDRPKGSYLTSLFEKGVASIAQKVGEEAVETVIEAIKGDQERFREEAADLFFH